MTQTADPAVVAFHFHISPNRLELSWDDAFLDGIFKRRRVSTTYDCPVSIDELDCEALLFGVLAPIINHHVDRPVGLDLGWEPKTWEAWKAYHLLGRVHPVVGASRSPLRSGSWRSLWHQLKGGGARASAGSQESKPAVGILYGGGKDSLLSFCLAKDLFPDADVQVLRIHWSPRSALLHKRAFERYCLQDLRTYSRFKYLSWSCDIHAVARKQQFVHPAHLGFHFGTGMPVFRSHRLGHVAFGYDALEFHTSEFRGGEEVFSAAYRRARPDVVGDLGRRLRQASQGASASNLLNLNFPVPGYAAFTLLSRHYATSLPAIYMCETLSKKWCGKCRKCFTYALLCTANRLVPADFDLRAFWEKSSYLTAILMQAPKAPDAYDDKLAYKKHYLAYVALIKGLDWPWVETQLGSACTVRLRQLAERSRADRGNDDHNAMWLQAVDRSVESQPELGPRLRELLSRPGVPTTDKPVIDGKVASLTVRYDLRQRAT